MVTIYHAELDGLHVRAGKRPITRGSQELHVGVLDWVEPVAWAAEVPTRHTNAAEVLKMLEGQHS